MKLWICGGVNKKIDKKYFSGIEELSNLFYDHGYDIFMVGSDGGCLRTIQTAYLKNNKPIEFIVPKCYEAEAKNLVGKKIKVESLYALQQYSISKADAIIILPGGNGTFAEIFMIIDNIKAGLCNKPVIIFNQSGFYDKLKELTQFLHSSGMITKKQLGDFVYANSTSGLMQMLQKIEQNKAKK